MSDDKIHHELELATLATVAAFAAQPPDTSRRAGSVNTPPGTRRANRQKKARRKLAKASRKKNRK